MKSLFRRGCAGGVRILHPGRHRACGVAAAHGAHVAGSDAGDASAGGNPQLRRAVAAGQRRRRARPLRLHGKQLALSIACDADCHAGHIVGNVKRVLALVSLHGAVRRRLGLIGGGLHIETSTIGGGGSGIFLQLLLHRVGGLGRRRIRGCHWTRRFIAASHARERDDQDERGVFHNTVIVNLRSETLSLRRAQRCFSFQSFRTRASGLRDGDRGKAISATLFQAALLEFLPAAARAR